jgi:alpha,alpha-trehalose-phosphate synthase [UDP-forming]
VKKTGLPPSGRLEHGLLAISNRLPDLRAPVSPDEERRRTVGGLVAALEPVLESRGGLWLGWSGRTTPGDAFGPVERGPSSRPALAWMDLPERAHELYYNGFCNRSLWPLFHSLPERVRFEDAEWEAYLAVNDRFAEVAHTLVPRDCAVWCHDFHLLTVAFDLRRRDHRGPLGLFLHVPFPSADLFRLIPWQKQLLEAMLAFDLIGFQTERDAKNFLESAATVGSADVSSSCIRIGTRSVQVGAFPIGIIPDRYEPPEELQENETTTALLQSFAGRRLIVGVDRLDYTKGIPERIEGFARLLASKPEWRGKLSLVQISVPSRVDVVDYQEQRQRIEAAVGRINGEFGEAHWTPVRYLYRSYHRGELSLLYRAADVCLVTPLRDGMNLVAKEYIAAQVPERPGVLVLSRFAGAACELDEAVLTNPFHPDGMARDIDSALRMPLEERRRRHGRLLAAVQRTTATSWAEGFVARLEESRKVGGPVSSGPSS